jgi:2,4-dienoyl-CoA reductase-like NADH-dependent reductase (Old Yellow Enzyme family)
MSHADDRLHRRFEVIEQTLRGSAPESRLTKVNDKRSGGDSSAAEQSMTSVARRRNTTPPLVWTSQPQPRSRMPNLFSPLRIRGVEFSNRVWVSPMCQYSAVHGVPGAWHRVHLGAFATGGAGLIMAEASGVTPEGRISIGCPGLWNEEQTAAWRIITDFAHSQGTKMGIQLAHAGRKASTMRPWSGHLMAARDEGGWTAVAPSAIAFEGYPVPHELEPAEIEALVAAYGAAAQRAVDAGFDVLEIHAAHGYLLHEFMSPLSNHRRDEFGGSFENRVRLTLAVVDSVRRAMPETMPLFVRISATDYVDGGWDLGQSVELSALMKQHGVDLVDVSSGGNVHGARIPVGPGFQVGFAETIRAKTGIATSAVGLITEPEQAQEIVANERADAVMLARAFLRNPRWALNAAEHLGVVIPWPPQFERARTLKP